MTRKQAREEAFILVFEKEFNDDSLQEKYFLVCMKILKRLTR